MIDDIYHKNRFGDFEFDRETADVFDDMVHRSIPFYDEIQRMLTEQALTYIRPGTNVYDLGCSTGTTLCLLALALEEPENVRLSGLDSSPDMIGKALTRIKQLKLNDRISVSAADITEAALEDASVVFLSYVLQFIRPLRRDMLIKNIYDSLVHGGVLLMTEKVLPDDSVLSRAYIDYYHNFKRRGKYSEMEISRKREALENVLVPYRVSENIELLRRNGFNIIDVFFKWYNFAGFIAIKR